MALITHRSSLSLVAVRAASRLQLRNSLFTKTGRHQMGRYFFHLWMLVVFFLVGGGSQQALAQVLYGSIVGNVTDQSGASIPRAVVKAKVFETNATFNTTTDEGGLYILTNIPPGTYDITISKPGFGAVEARKILVVINTPVRVDATLQVGAAPESVTVSAEATSLQTDLPDVHANLRSPEFLNLPQPTRTYEGLIGLVAGFAPPFASGGGTNNPARSMVLQANGTSTEGTDVRIEGVSDVNAWVQVYSNAVPSVEAIETVNVVTSSPGVDQGLASGATINVQLKSGGNDFHGELYEFHQDSALKARPFFLPVSQAKPELIDNTLGGALGGPISKNKLFFFASYEGDFLRQTSGQFGTVPTDAMKSGDFSQTGTPIFDPSTGNPDGTGKTQFSGNIIPPDRISPISKKLLALVPSANVSTFGPYSNNFFGNLPTHYNLQKIDTKIDYNATSKLRISGRLDVEPYLETQVAIFGNTLGTSQMAGYPIPNQHGDIYGFTGSATYTVSPTFVVDGAVGFTRADQLLIPIHGSSRYTAETLGIPGTNLGTLPSAGGLAQFNINGYTGYGEAYNYLQYSDPVFGYSANFTKVSGKHTVKWGFNIRSIHMNHVETGPDGFSFNGGVTALNGGPPPNQFNGYADFLLGLPQSWVNRQLVERQNETKLRNTDYSLYAGDKWEIIKKLTVSYGTGWEYYPVPTHGSHGLETYIPATNTYEVCGYGSIPKDCGIKVSKRLFAPRVGIAYRLSSTLVFRAGYSLTNEQAISARDGIYNYPEILGYSASALNPFVAVGTLTAGIPVTPAPNLDTGIISPIPPGISFQTMPLNFIRGYVQSYNVAIQKGFRAWIAQAAYVGTHTVHGHSRTNINYGQVGGGVASQPLYKLDGISSYEAEILPDGYSHYNSLQATLERPFVGSLQMKATYTYSKWIGEPGVASADGQPLIPIPQYRYLDRAVMTQDLTHIFNLSGILQSPFGKGKRYLSQAGVGSALLGGWQLSAVLTARSGFPFSILADGTSLNAPGSTQRADRVKQNVAMPRTVSEWFDPYAFAPVTAVRFGTAGFNSVRGPGAVNLDLSLFRDFRLTERWKVQFRAEAFNFTNTPHFANPASNVSVVQYATNPDGSSNYNHILNLNGFDQITAVNPGSRLVDERYLRFGMKLLF